MKSFIVAALLVAAVAGQSMDMMKLNKESALFKFDRQVYPMGEELNTFVYGKDFDFDREFHVYQYEEIMSHPLFREYMTLPIFRQYWSYPMFQRYVTSVFFQRFWEIPAFKQYFVNPTYFYKYVLPIVQLFKYDEVTMKTFPFQYQTGYDYLYTQQRDLLNFRNIPTICQYNSVYCKALLEKFYNHMTTMMTYYGQEETMTPYTTTYTPYMYKYNPYVARMIQKNYYNRYPVTEMTEETYPVEYYNRYPVTEMTKETYPVEYYNRYPYAYNKYNTINKYNKDMNMFETEKMINEIYPTGVNYERVYPTMMMGKNFDKKMVLPETMIKA